MRAGPRRPAKSEGLGLLFDALGGTAAVARMFGRDPSTAAKWRAGALPLLADIAKALRERTMHVIGRLQDEVWRLKSDEIPKAEYRAQRGLARRRQAFFKRFGVWPHGDPVRQERMRARRRDFCQGGEGGR